MEDKPEPATPGSADWTSQDPSIEKAVRKVLRRHEDREDAAQDARADLWTHWGSYPDSEDEQRALSYTIAVRRALDLNAKTRRRAGLQPKVVEHLREAERNALARSRAAAAVKRLLMLSDDFLTDYERTALEGHLHGVSDRELARALESTPGAVKKARHVAYAKLRKAVATNRAAGGSKLFLPLGLALQIQKCLQGEVYTTLLKKIEERKAPE